MIQSYPDRLLMGKLVPWYDECLSKPNPPGFTTKRGFQSRINNFSSDVRTRALELYRLGIFKGPLIQPKAPGQGQDIPEGWNLVQRGEDVLTPLGRISYNIGCDNDNSIRWNSIFNLLCSVFVTSLVEKNDKEENFFLFELQKYIEENLKIYLNNNINLRRYAAICLVSCIHSSKLGWLTAKYQEQEKLKEFVFQQKGLGSSLHRGE